MRENDREEREREREKKRMRERERETDLSIYIYIHTYIPIMGTEQEVLAWLFESLSVYVPSPCSV